MRDTATFTFKLIGRTDAATGAWLMLRAPTWSTSRRKGLDAHAFENQVFEWLTEEVDPDRWHLGNGDAPGYPALPHAFSTGSGLCLLLKGQADLIRFANQFRVADLAILDTVLEAA